MKRFIFLLIAFFFITGFMFLSGNPGLRCLQRAVVFDGTNDYMARGADITGIADGKQGLLAFWFKFNGGNGVAQKLINAEGYHYLNKGADNKFNLTMWGITPAVALRVFSTTAYTADATWHHLMASWDLANNKKFLYIDGVDDLTADTLVNDTIGYESLVANWGIGADQAGGGKSDADIAEFFFHTTYLDLSVAANRAKLYSSAGKPVNIGSDGSLVLGVQPLVYQSVRSKDAATVFATNKGTGGDFTITGALTLSATSPCN